MYGSRCNGTMDTPNGSKAVTLLLRLSTLALALTSAVVMATASECTIYGLDGAKATVTFKDYPPLVYVYVNSMARSHVVVRPNKPSYIRTYMHQCLHAC